jgi:hypothetical protein
MALAAFGLALSLPALFVALSLGTGGPFDPIGSQTRGVSRGLDQLDAALDRVESSLTAAAATLDQGRRASLDASGVTAELATAMSELSAASSVEVFGVQPFAPIAPRFSEIATRSQALASSLTGTAGSLEDTRTQLTGLRTDVGDLRSSVQELGGGQPAIGGPSLLITRLLLALLVLWLAASSAVGLVSALRELRELPRRSA